MPGISPAPSPTYITQPIANGPLPAFVINGRERLHVPIVTHKRVSFIQSRLIK